MHKLKKNYRSTGNILTTVAAIHGGGGQALTKTLRPVRPGPGRPVKIKELGAFSLSIWSASWHKHRRVGHRPDTEQQDDCLTLSSRLSVQALRQTRHSGSAAR